MNWSHLNEEDVVELEVLVLEDGTTGRVEIKKSSEFPLLDEAAKTLCKCGVLTPLQPVVKKSVKLMF